MSEFKSGGDDAQKRYSLTDYRHFLRDFDASVCEAIAVSQACAQRLESPAIGYSTHVFTRICAHAQSMIRAIPKSRWAKRDFELWDVSCVAAHARSIIEGYLLFRYLADAPADLEVQRAYVQVMHLYDCTKRIKILPFLLSDEELEGFKAQAEVIRGRLNGISYFSELDAKLKRDLLSGRYLTIASKKELVSSAGISQEEYEFYWNYLSQYTHVLSFTFYRLEPGGRGSGLENEFDIGALCLVLQFCTPILTKAVDRLVEIFPDTKEVRKGVDSKFSPGPARNLPKNLKRGRGKLTRNLI
tara:strand:+ start:225 stop:1124 length:900 start_codon:yes stop_codon:yes gene_type:complete